MKEIYLYPGKLAAPGVPSRIRTILGSCVGVALFDPVRKIGGLNHYLLPDMGSTEKPSGRYGTFAIPALVEALESQGAKRSLLQAKIFGGANVLGDVSIGIGVGRRNIAKAEELLAEKGIRVVERNLGGDRGRRIILRTDTFEVEHELNSEDVSGFGELALPKNVRVAIVDDSATARNIFQKIFVKRGLTVVGVAADAYQARELIVRENPDVITLDIEMPRLSGVAFLEKLMKHRPTPVVMVSSLGSQGEAALRALELGAVEFVQKPTQFDPQILSQLGEILVEKVRAAAAIPLLKKRQKQGPASSSESSCRPKSTGELKLVVVGGNAGSQASLDHLLSSLAADTPPVVVANATITSFLDVYLKKLEPRVKTGLTVAKDGERLKVGMVYFAPPEAHVSVRSDGMGFMTLEVRPGPPVCGQRPAADVLFKSAAEAFGSGCIGILLSGFGSDGVDGLARLYATGSTTWVEHPDHAAFPYAPQKAVAIGVAEQVLCGEEMGAMMMGTRNRRIA